MERNIADLIDEIKQHPDYSKAGMILCHNGVVRETSREGDTVSGLKIRVDHDRLRQVLEHQKQMPGIIDILIHIFEDRDLMVGDDVMYLVVAGDIRENVLACMADTLNRVKKEVTFKTQFFID